MKKLIDGFFNRLIWNSNKHRDIELRKRYNINSSVRFDALSLEGNISIGSNSYINSGGRIDSGDHSSVTIGHHCAIGRWVHITSKTHSLEFPTTAEDNPVINHDEADTIIGDYVWIGDHVVIAPGVHIGNFAIIGANSFVNNNVKEFEIVGGVPAKHIRFNTEHRRFPK